MQALSRAERCPQCHCVLPQIPTMLGIFLTRSQSLCRLRLLGPFFFLELRLGAYGSGLSCGIQGSEVQHLRFQGLGG